MKLFELLSKQKKAGILPYILVDGLPTFIFMKSSNPNFGGSAWSIAKGGIDPGETSEQAAIREGSEELGLKKENLKLETLKKVFVRVIEGEKSSYIFTVYTVEVKDKDDFNKPHFETKATKWMTNKEYKKVGRKTHRHIVNKAHESIVK